MATLSLAMIVKNEERTLQRILEGARAVCDEMIVVDTGSSDATVAIATAMGAKVFHFAWIDDFAAARNFAFEQATQDWIVWFDADDVLPVSSQEAIRKLKTTVFNQPDIDAVFAPYHYWINERGEVMQKFDRERFLRRSSNPRWQGAVHENISTVSGRTTRCVEAYVDHLPHPDCVARKEGRNIRIMEAVIDVEKDKTHDVFQFACELQWNNRPADAARVFGVYLRREKGQPDDLGEQYLACIKMADCLHQGGHFDAAMSACRDAIGLDPTRAEAHCLAGRFYMGRNQWLQAWPYLVAAASLHLPANSPNIVFKWFYNDAPRQDLLTCAAHLENKVALAEQIKLLAVATMTGLVQHGQAAAQQKAG